MNRKLDKQLRISKDKAKFTHFFHHSHISEQFRTMRTNISFLGIGNKFRTIMVTSPSEGEGKTTIVANLSIVFAQQGKKVLLIDANLRTPMIHKIFDQSNYIGLSNVLSYMNSLKESISNSGIYNLDLLPSGPIPPNPSDLISSDRMSEIIEQVQEKYDIVLIDTPPILNVSDSQLIANLCQGAILVLRSGKTSKESALKAKELLYNTNARLLGASLNEGNQKVNA